MVFEQIERLKSEYTDKYVVVDDSRPELNRFKGFTGTVRTVNMSGRALVEFDGHDNDIGWYDIDIDFLKVIDEPLPKEEPVKKAPAKKPEAQKAADKPAKKAGGAMSVEEMLAAARANKPTGGAKAESAPAAKSAATAKVDPSKMSVEEMLAAARANKPAGGAKKETAPAAKKEAPAKLDPSKMSVEEMLAAARANTPAGGAKAEDAPASEELVLEESAADEPVEDEPASSEDLPTDVDGMVAYCRKVDGGS